MHDHKMLKQNNESELTGKAHEGPIPIVRLKFWEIETAFRCPVVGMCLTSSEQKQLVKKVKISGKIKTPFDIHEVLVSGGKSENCLSLKTDRLLDRKFGSQVVSLLHLKNMNS